MRQQRILIESWCDICSGETEERVPSTSEIEFAFDGMKYAMDLCDVHKDPAWSAMLEYATEIGPIRKMGRPKKSNPLGMYPCSECGERFHTKQAMAGHYAGAHTIFPADKVNCPYCDFVARGPQGMPPHIRSRHPAEALAAKEA